MPAPIKVRPNYRGDMAWASRLQAAIELDERRKTDWRRRVSLVLGDLILLLQEANIEEGRRELEQQRRAVDEPETPERKKVSRR